MAKKKNRKVKAVTYEFPDNLKEMTNASYKDVKKVAEFYNRSNTAHYVDRLDEILDGNYQLSNWEVEQMNALFDKFATKYNSPLAKALK